ncbi:MAG: hypothetical protein QME28_01020 [Candidatus Saccharicenans sp.]|nr:hypothetical protein [Candidatus Saccharicenans sp.]
MKRLLVLILTPVMLLAASSFAQPQVKKWELGIVLDFSSIKSSNSTDYFEAFILAARAGYYAWKGVEV